MIDALIEAGVRDFVAGVLGLGDVLGKVCTCRENSDLGHQVAQWSWERENNLKKLVDSGILYARRGDDFRDRANCHGVRVGQGI